MKVRKAIKKLVAIGTGAVMMGATVVGAMAAADLADYPEPFIKNGMFDGLIVVGENAASSDVVGAIDIAFSLQYGAKTTSTVSTGGAVGETTLSGDAALFKGGSDHLELNEELGNVKETFTEADLAALASGLVSTDEGTTDYNQYLRFESGTTTFPGKVLYSEDEDEVVGDFLFWSDGGTIFEYELEFEEGLESDIVSGDMDDLEDEGLVILGRKFNVVTADITTSTDQIELVLLGGDVVDTLVEGETKTYTINGQDFEVKLLIVSDTTSKVKMYVNGELTDDLTEGETDTLSDGTLLGIRDVLPNEGEEEEGGDLVEFYLGAEKLELTDTNYSLSSNTDWYSGGVEVNDENIEDSLLIIDMTELSTSKAEINSIKYRLAADSSKGDVFIAPGSGLRSQLDEPEGLISANWDITYEGLTEPGHTVFEVRSNGDDEYDIYFTTHEGLDYKVPYVDNSNSDGFQFKYGDNDDDLQFIEAPSIYGNHSNAGFWVTEDDYFVLGDVSDEDDVLSHVLRYESIDTSNREIQFSDLAGGQKEVVYDTTTLDTSSSTAQGELVVGGRTYSVWVGPSNTSFGLAIDLDNSGAINGGEAKLSLPGEIVVDLGYYDDSYFNQSGLNNNQTMVIPGQSGSSQPSVNLTFTVSSDEFDESSARGDEVVVINVTSASNNQVDLSVDTNSNVTMHSVDDEDLNRGMSDFGTWVEITDNTNSNDADDVTLHVPKQQRFAQVYVTFGETASTTTSGANGGSVEVTQVEKINVGAAQLDKDVSDVWAQNLIVVGGPCANEVAAEVMGVSAGNCADGFEDGKAMVKLYEGQGKVAMLVAGYSALDTRRAARVVADADKYADDLVGKEVVVTGTTLKDITVSQPTPVAAEAPAEEAEEEVAEEETTEEEA